MARTEQYIRHRIYELYENIYVKHSINLIFAFFFFFYSISFVWFSLSHIFIFIYFIFFFLSISPDGWFSNRLLRTEYSQFASFSSFRLNGFYFMLVSFTNCSYRLLHVFVLMCNLWMLIYFSFFFCFCFVLVLRLSKWGFCNFLFTVEYISLLGRE